ncbi:hypothetical protein [Ensifer sp. SSB1]|jgi:hypothetical protein|uniref:hypothetical protein n=1 Tax=Ensifer sp. SSB1 TaxID=2795385 RepID=UPI001A3F8399|nr:hypothetical protein [Ensifer sp. SSB1]MBK5569199.1 hypothetical protein [Ensifer sp. SSB1]
MLEHWAVMWTVLRHERRREKRNGLDDPLDGPEWRGLHWVLPIFSFLLSRRLRPEAHPTRPAATPAGAHWEATACRCGPRAFGHDR